MRTTTNFGLRLPDATDVFNIEDLNHNMEIIDQNLGGGSGGSGYMSGAVTSVVSAAFPAVSHVDITESEEN